MQNNPVVTYSNFKKTVDQSKELATMQSVKAKSARQSKLKQRAVDSKAQVSSFIVQKSATGLSSMYGPETSV